MNLNVYLNMVISINGTEEKDYVWVANTVCLAGNIAVIFSLLKMAFCIIFIYSTFLTKYGSL